MGEMQPGLQWNTLALKLHSCTPSFLRLHLLLLRRVSAVGGTFGNCRQLVRCGFVVAQHVSPQDGSFENMLGQMGWFPCAQHISGRSLLSDSSMSTLTLGRSTMQMA